MGKWKHRLSNINEEAGVADCAVCGNGVRVRFKKNGKNRGTIATWRCRRALKEQDIGTKARRRQDGKVPLDCARCGFRAEHKCQIDWHHKNGNHKDNDSFNKEAMCANCHRLVTFLGKHWLPLSERLVESVSLC